MDDEEIEELDDEDYETELVTRTDLTWTCKNCGEVDTEFDIPFEKEIIVKCEKCGKKYSVYYCPY